MIAQCMTFSFRSAAIGLDTKLGDVLKPGDCVNVQVKQFHRMMPSIAVEKGSRVMCDCRGKDDLMAQSTLEVDKNRITDLVVEASGCVRSV